MPSPSIKVIGLYSPKGDRVRYEAFLESEIASRDPKNFTSEERDVFRRLGREADLGPLTDEDKAEMRDHLDRELGSAVLLEVLVENADDNFSVGDFQQPHPTQPPSFWQVAWDERFLSSDGYSVVADDPTLPPSIDGLMRIVFYIHYWQSDQPLYSSYGPLQLPSVEPMPERLWTLAPYREVD